MTDAFLATCVSGGGGAGHKSEGEERERHGQKGTATDDGRPQLTHASQGQAVDRTGPDREVSGPHACWANYDQCEVSGMIAQFATCCPECLRFSIAVHCVGTGLRRAPLFLLNARPNLKCDTCDKYFL